MAQSPWRMEILVECMGSNADKTRWREMASVCSLWRREIQGLFRRLAPKERADLRELWFCATTPTRMQELVASNEERVNYVINLCANGYLHTTRLLVDTFEWTAVDARAGNNVLLISACACGHLELACWLTNRFELTAQDARAFNQAALRSACANGHLEMARWLTDRFGLTAADARVFSDAALRCSYGNGHLGVARWLISRFGLTSEESGRLLTEENRAVLWV